MSVVNPYQSPVAELDRNVRPQGDCRREGAFEFRRELERRSLAERSLVRPRLADRLQLPNPVSTPAIVAVMNVAMEPPSTARSPKRARSLRRSGASPPMPPI